MRLVGALDRPDAAVQGQDAACSPAPEPAASSSRPIRCPPSPTPTSLLDFTAPDASVAYSELSAQARIVHVIGTTGHDAERTRRA